MAEPKKHMRTFHDRLKIIEEVEKNPGEKRVDIAKRLGLSAGFLSTSSIIFNRSCKFLTCFFD